MARRATGRAIHNLRRTATAPTETTPTAGPGYVEQHEEQTDVEELERQARAERIAGQPVGEAVAGITSPKPEAHSLQELEGQARAERIAGQPVGEAVAGMEPAPDATSDEEETLEALERLAELKERGMLTDQEFAVQKAKILGTLTSPG
jgi:hypothetical protein